MCKYYVNNHLYLVFWMISGCCGKREILEFHSSMIMKPFLYWVLNCSLPQLTAQGEGCSMPQCLLQLSLMTLQHHCFFSLLPRRCKLSFQFYFFVFGCTDWSLPVHVFWASWRKILKTEFQDHSSSSAPATVLLGNFSTAGVTKDWQGLGTD